MSERVKTALVVVLLIAFLGSCGPVLMSAMEHEHTSRSYHDGLHLEEEMLQERVSRMLNAGRQP